MTSPPSRVRVADVWTDPLDAAACLAAVGDDAAGGTALFVGTVRDVDDGRPVTELEYEAHPSAAAVLREVAERVAVTHPAAVALAVVHRAGALAIGDVAVVAAASAPHRGEAFDAARALVEAVKAEIPVWKMQRFTDGATEWVGSA